MRRGRRRVASEPPGAPAPLFAWLPEPLSPEAALGFERLARTEDVRRIAVMPDAHWAEDVCVGAVVATARTLLPCAVGGDIGCGVAALAFHGEARHLADERVAARLLEGLYRAVPAIRHGRVTAAPRLPDGLAGRPLSDPSLEAVARRDGRVELGTLGRGNHFLELQSDGEGRLWCMVHSGSRAMGQAIRALHERRGEPTATGLRRLEADSEEGRAYLADAAWASVYADLNRRAIVDALARVVREVLGVEADPASWIACDHNHVRPERHEGEPLWVHRKGAISARDGEPGIVPGSMGAPSYHVLGRGCPRALCSTSHGAGRALGRAEARRRISARDLERQMRGVWFDHRRLDALRDEAPAAYKDVGAVMRAQAELTRIVRKLTPLLSFKG